MTTDPFTEAAHVKAVDLATEALRRAPEGGEWYAATDSLRAMAEWARTHLAAQEPGVQHLWRPGATPRAFCGDESAQAWAPVTREESLAVPVCSLCHRRAMHESYNLWADQDPTDAEVEASAQELWKHRALGTVHPNYPWDGLAPELRQSLRELARATLAAARAAQRDEEKR